MDLLTGGKRKHFDPRLYINTTSGFLLTFIKLIESAAAAAAGSYFPVRRAEPSEICRAVPSLSVSSVEASFFSVTFFRTSP